MKKVDLSLLIVSCFIGGYLIGDFKGDSHSSCPLGYPPDYIEEDTGYDHYTPCSIEDIEKGNRDDPYPPCYIEEK